MIVLGAVVAIAAAARSTWSPCGLSMLSTITPFGERSRGHRYYLTAAWFVAGAILGGATLGGLAAGLAALAAAAGVAGRPGWMASLAAAAAATGAAVDAGAFGEVIPLWRRQVDDGWLSRYRRWVYASGFGWQIGVGVATYIMTAAVFLVVVLAALTGQPLTALAVCAGFGLARGVAVLATARAGTPARLRDLHRGFNLLGPVVREAVIVVQAGVALVAVGAQWPAAGLVAGVGTLVAVSGVAAGRRVAGRRAADRRVGGQSGRAAARVARQ
jgi:hypothetical protein